MQFEKDKLAISVGKFGKITVITNPVPVAQIFKTIWIIIFKRFFAAKSIEGDLFGPVFIYFGNVETNDWGIMHLHYFVLLQKVFYLVKLRNYLLFNAQYAADMIKFIDNVICCSIANILIAKKTN